jgi:hypothetical protein
VGLRPAANRAMRRIWAVALSRSTTPGSMARSVFKRANFDGSFDGAVVAELKEFRTHEL